MGSKDKVTPYWEWEVNRMVKGLHQFATVDQKIHLAIGPTFGNNRREYSNLTGNYYCPEYKDGRMTPYSCECCARQFQFKGEPDDQCPTARTARQIMLCADEWWKRQGIAVRGRDSKINQYTKLPPKYFNCFECVHFTETKRCTIDMCVDAPTLKVERCAVNGKPWKPSPDPPDPLIRIITDVSPFYLEPKK